MFFLNIPLCIHTYKHTHIYMIRKLSVSRRVIYCVVCISIHILWWGGEIILIRFKFQGISTGTDTVYLVLSTRVIIRLVWQVWQLYSRKSTFNRSHIVDYLTSCKLTPPSIQIDQDSSSISFKLCNIIILLYRIMGNI